MSKNLRFIDFRIKYTYIVQTKHFFSLSQHLHYNFQQLMQFSENMTWYRVWIYEVINTTVSQLQASLHAYTQAAVLTSQHHWVAMRQRDRVRVLVNNLANSFKAFIKKPENFPSLNTHTAQSTVILFITNWIFLGWIMYRYTYADAHCTVIVRKRKLDTAAFHNLVVSPQTQKHQLCTHRYTQPDESKYILARVYGCGCLWVADNLYIT